MAKRGSAGDERRDNDPTVGLIALTVGLYLGAVFEAIVDHPALARAHRLELNRIADIQRSPGRAVSLTIEELLAALTIPGGIDDDPLALGVAHKRGSVAEQLHGVDRCATPADQDPQLLAVDPDRNRIIGLGNLSLSVEVESIEDLLDNISYAVNRGPRRLAVQFHLGVTHALSQAGAAA